MANNIETLFPNSRTETTKKGKKKYTLIYPISFLCIPKN